MYKHKLYSSGGFTLVELIIGMALITLLMSAALGILSTSIKAWQMGKAKVESQQIARLALDLMTREIRYAQKAELVTGAAPALKITKVDGETNIFKVGSPNAKTLYVIIDRTKATPSGGSSTNPITENVVKDFKLEIDQTQRTVTITIETTDTANKCATKLQSTVGYLNTGE